MIGVTSSFGGVFLIWVGTLLRSVFVFCNSSGRASNGTIPGSSPVLVSEMGFEHPLVSDGSCAWRRKKCLRLKFSVQAPPWDVVLAGAQAQTLFQQARTGESQLCTCRQEQFSLSSSMTWTTASLRGHVGSFASNHMSWMDRYHQRSHSQVAMRMDVAPSCTTNDAASHVPHPCSHLLLSR